ncbi:hypothetical protein SAMN05216375_13035 [Trichococcus ilyis]|jgi:hypothetical protein|uniref:Uncharacterized protein n=1 Tax=Trichococcus ilyis TaxID=640938 RepID=A0A143Z8Y8_9LACT|nr:Hypothetical protein TR210_2689 [Trichococcus ilyis]SEJ84168.1 hypothetical protein SAMN05216375_13035 [Trichococcus ilyis]
MTKEGLFHLEKSSFCGSWACELFLGQVSVGLALITEAIQLLLCPKGAEAYLLQIS